MSGVKDFVRVIVCAVIAFISAASWAADFPVTSSQCTGPGGLLAAVQQANATPGPDTITMTPGLVIYDDCSFAGPTRVDDSILEITDSVTINANFARFQGHNQFVTTTGLVTPSIWSCPNTDGSLITGVSLGLFQIGSRTADNTGLEVVVNQFVVADVSHFAQIRDKASLTLNQTVASRILDIQQCSEPALRAYGSAELTLEEFSLDVYGSYQPTVPNSMISGGTGKLEIYNSVLQTGRRSLAITWAGGDVDIISSKLSNSGGLTFLGGTARIINSLINPAADYTEIRYTDQMVFSNADVTFEASTILYPTIDCKPFGAGGTNYPDDCQWNPDSTSTIRATNGSTLTFKESVVHVQDPVEMVYDPLLLEKTSGSTINVINAFIQPVEGQNAAAIQAIVDTTTGVLLTGTDALSVVGAGQVAFQAGSFPDTVTPIITGGRILVDVINTSDDLFDPRANLITTDILGAPRYDSGNRSLGAVQNHVIPHLIADIEPANPNTADLAWNQPTSTGIVGYDLCYGVGAAPDPVALGTNCASAGGTLVLGFTGSVSTLTGTVSSLPNASTIWFLVRAFASGPSPEPWSNVALVNTPVTVSYPKTTIIPGTPVNLVPTIVGTITNPVFAVVSGTLPAGLTLNPTTGVISGTPTGGSTGNLVISATGNIHNGTVTSLAGLLLSSPPSFVPIPVWLLAVLVMGMLVLVRRKVSG